MNTLRRARLSLQMAREHAVRTTLSIVAIAIGVAVTILVAGLMKAGDEKVRETIDQMGADVVVIQSIHPPQGRASDRSAIGLRRTDTAVILRHFDGIRCIAAMTSARKSVRWRGRTHSAEVVGVDPDYFCVRRMSAVGGRLFTREDERRDARIAVLGRTVARDLFSSETATSATIVIDRVPYRVIGIAAPRGIDPAGNDLDDVVYIPLAGSQRRIFGSAYCEAIVAAVTDDAAMKSLENDVNDVLLHAHRRRPRRAFAASDASQLIRGRESAGSLFRAAAIALASVSLLIGFVGTYSVIRISFRERFVEIGVRRAVGARRLDIFVQFVYEAAAVAVIGAGAGAVVGTLAEQLAVRFLDLPPVLPYVALLAAPLASVVVATLCGGGPAVAAARLPAVEAFKRV